MEQPATPTSGSKGKPITPKSRRKSPGDLLGSGKSQSQITRFYSPPEWSGKTRSTSKPVLTPAVNRQSSESSSVPKKKQRLETEYVLSKDLGVQVLSGDSSDEVFTQDISTNSRPERNASVPPSRLNDVKRCLYPETSSQTSQNKTSTVSRPRKRRSSKSTNKRLRPKIVISSSDEFTEEFSMQDSRLSSKPQLDSIVPCSQVVRIKRQTCPETSSQSVLISSSDDSDFELHNSKKTHNSFLSQSLCKDVTSKSMLKRFHSKMDRSKPGKKDEDSFQDEKPTQVTPPAVGKPELCSSGTAKEGDTSVPESTPNPSPGFASKDTCNTLSSSRFQANESNIPSIYLQTTIPWLAQNMSQIDLSDEEIDSAPTVSKNEQPVPVSKLVVDNADELLSHDNYPNYQELPTNHPIYDETTVDPVMERGPASNSDLAFDFVDEVEGHDPHVSTNLSEGSLPISSQEGAVIDPSDEELDDSHGMENQLTYAESFEASKTYETSLGVVPLTELLGVTHVSDSDGEVHSDENDSVIEGSIDMFPNSSDMLSHQQTSLFVDASPECSGVITPIMNAVLDASSEFFSDAISMSSTVEQDPVENEKPGKELRRPDSRTAVMEDDGQNSIASTMERIGRGSACSSSSGDCLEIVAPVEEQESSADRDNVLNMNHPPPSSSAVLESSTVELTSGNAESTAADSLGSQSILPKKPLTSAMTDPPGLASCCMPCGDHDMTTLGDGAMPEIKIICGSRPSDNLTKFQIAQAPDKTLLHNSHNTLLLDDILSECQNYAGSVLNCEPIKHFVATYLRLPPSTKITLHYYLLELLEDPNLWLKYSEDSSASIGHLVSCGILEYLDRNDELLAKLNTLSYSELRDILCKLGNSPAKCADTMKNLVLNKFSSSYTCERVKIEVTQLINQKFVKMTSDAASSIKICVELFALPLGLHDRFYKTSEILRYANSLVPKLSQNNKLIPLTAMSKLSVDPSRVLCDLSDLCRLKSEVFESDLNDKSIPKRVDRICANIAVLEYSSESDPSIKNSPTFRFLLVNYVHALDEQLKKLFYVNSSGIECSACVYLGVLLKQNVAGFPLKAKWCRERMRFLLKLLDVPNIFEEFSRALKEPVSPIDFLVRSDFISSALNIKRLGLTRNEKSQLTRLLRPVTHIRTQIPFVQLQNITVIGAPKYYEILTKKAKGRNFYLARASVFEQYKSEFPYGAEDDGKLLFNAIFLVFLEAVYLRLDGVFVSRFQKSPLDWGSEEFFSKRANFIDVHVASLKKRGLASAFELIDSLLENFQYQHCVVDWVLTVPNMNKIRSILKTLELDRFLNICIHLLGKVDERTLGFPELVLWNEESGKIKFVALKKPSDPLYAYQILWLEKLSEMGVDAEECQISGYSGSKKYTPSQSESLPGEHVSSGRIYL